MYYKQIISLRRLLKPIKWAVKINYNMCNQCVFTIWIYFILPFILSFSECRNYTNARDKSRGFSARSRLLLAKNSQNKALQRERNRTKRIICTQDSRSLRSRFFVSPQHFVSHRFALLSSLIRRGTPQLAGKGLSRQG